MEWNEWHKSLLAFASPLMQPSAPAAAGLQRWLSQGSAVPPAPSAEGHPPGVRSHALSLTLRVHDIM